MPGKDLDRWEETEEGVWQRKLIDSEYVDVAVEVAVEPPAAEPPAEPEFDATDGAIEAAAELGVDLATVSGTGLNGRITKADVEDAHTQTEG